MDDVNFVLGQYDEGKGVASGKGKISLPMLNLT